MESQETPSNENLQPAFEPEEKSNKSSKHVAIIVVLAILAVGGLGFGGFEFWQNIRKNDEIKSLQSENKEKDNKISNLENKNCKTEEKEEEPSQNPSQNCDNDTLSSDNESDNSEMSYSSLQWYYDGTIKFLSSAFWRHIDEKTSALLDSIYSEYNFTINFLESGEDGVSEIMKINVGRQTNKKTDEMGGSYLAFYYRPKHGDDWTKVFEGNGVIICSDVDKSIIDAFGDSLKCNE